MQRSTRPRVRPPGAERGGSGGHHAAHGPGLRGAGGVGGVVWDSFAEDASHTQKIVLDLFRGDESFFLDLKAKNIKN